MERIIYASEGKIFTNGEVYGKQIHLAIGTDPNDYYEITEEEYNQILEREYEVLGGER